MRAEAQGVGGLEEPRRRGGGGGHRLRYTEGKGSGPEAPPPNSDSSCGSAMRRERAALLAAIARAAAVRAAAVRAAAARAAAPCAVRAATNRHWSNPT